MPKNVRNIIVFGSRLLSASAIVALILLSACGTGPSERADQVSQARPAGDVTLERLLNADAEPGQWLTGGRDWRQSYYSPLTQISKRNVTKLGYAWSSSLIDVPQVGLEATPIVVDGRMFTSGLGGEVYALDARTGTPLWSFKPELSPNAVVTGLGGVNRGVAVWRGKVYVAATDAQLYALDAEAGTVLWKADTVIDHSRAYFSTGAPYVAGKYVLIGNGGADFDARGYVSAYDLETGKLGWRFFTVPGHPKKSFEHPELEMAAKTWDPDSLWDLGLGGTAWDGMAYDPELNLVYVGTGNGLPWNRALRSPKGGDNLFLASVLAIDANTGALKWYYQTTPGDSWDYTATAKMILADLTINGQRRKILMQAPKNGFFYVLDRATGELLSAEPYVYRNWASHVDMRTGRPVETAQADYTHEPKLIFPMHGGGHNWQPMSYSPSTGLVYIATMHGGEVFGSLTEPFKSKRRAGGNTGTIARLVANLPVGWPSADELKADWPDPAFRTFLLAWDPVRQKEVWKVETTSKYPSMSGGVISSAAGLVFEGDADGYLYVFDAANGKRLHSMKVGSRILAAPMTYTAGNEQFVAVMAGATGDKGGRIVAFRLGGGEIPQLFHAVDSTGSIKPSVEDATDMTEVERGQKFFESNCALCHLNNWAPDLTRMTAETHREFLGIVRNGARTEKGMPNFRDAVSESEAKAIHAYIIHDAWETYRRQNKGAQSEPH